MHLRTTALCAALICAACNSEPDPQLQAHLFKGDPPAELAPGDTLSGPDVLSMVVTTQRPLYLYVVNEDAAGDRRLIFPCSTWRKSRRLGTGSHRLPAPGRFWEVASVTPREHLFVIASEQRIDLLETTMLDAAGPQPCMAAVTAGASRWIDELLRGGRHRGVWVSIHELKETASHG